MSVLENYEPTIAFVNDLSNTLRSGKSFSFNRRQRRAFATAPIFNSYWDFSTIDRITIPVALMIASEYHRASTLGRWRPSAIDIYKWKPDVRSMLAAVGFLELSGVDRPTAPIFVSGTQTIRRFRACGDAPGPEIGSFLSDLGLSFELLPPEIYAGLFEAILNTANHAYATMADENAATRLWWMSGSFDTSTRELVCSIYDHGVSIPVSLAGPAPKWPLSHIFKRLWRKARGRPLSVTDDSADGFSISLAMRLGKSRTGRENRGKGLPAIDNVIELCDDGYVAIRSRRGEYTRYKGMEPVVSTNVTPIRGTLIVWRAKLPVMT